MAIYLDGILRNYLETKFSNLPDWDWKGKLFADKLRVDRERVEKMASCQHIPTDYQGKKRCCSKCGAFYARGMGESWSNLDYGDQFEQEHLEEMISEVKEAMGERD